MSEEFESVHVDDFINFAETYASKAQADQSARSFNDMSDAELMECLSEYLGSGVANVSINNSLIEEMQRLLEEAFMSEDELEELDNPTSARAMDAKRRKFADRLGDILEDQENRQEERRQLEEWEKEILSKQNIDIGGTTASALEWTNALDQVLDNWDSSFDDMVSQGLAESGDKDKKKQEVSKLRKIMANPKTSEAEKQKLIQQGLASGEFSPGTVTYVTQVMENNKTLYAATTLDNKTSAVRDAGQASFFSEETEKSRENERMAIRAKDDVSLGIVKYAQSRADKFTSVPSALSAENIPDMQGQFQMATGNNPANTNANAPVAPAVVVAATAQQQQRAFDNV